jgi:hypothetical protein
MEAGSLTSLDAFSEVLGRLPAGMDLDRLAREHKAIRRRRAVDGGATLLRLALARGPGGKSLRETAAWATLSGLAEISNPGLKMRLDNAVEFLGAIVSGLLATRQRGGRLHWPGRHLQLADGTSISQPGSQGTDWRVHGVYDLGRGGFSHLEVTDARGGENLNRGTPVAGEVRIADRGFSTAPALHRFRLESDGQADFIVRMRWGSFRLRTPDGVAFDVIQHLNALAPTPAVHEVMVHAVVDDAPMLPLRLVMLRKPPEATEAARKALRQAARRKQKKLDPRSLIAAEFILLATSLPTEIEAEDILAAYRLRWQIELAFKRMKSLIHIDRLPTQSERGSRSWLYAHLILALLTDSLSQDILDSPPSGPC